MKLSLKTIIPALLLVSLTLGCSLIDRLKKQAEADKGTQVVTSKDNKCQLTVPASWDTALNVNSVASLQTGNIMARQYAIVITEGKSALTNGIDLEKYTGAVRENAKANLMVQGMVVSDPRQVIVNGYPAMQFEANGTTAGIKIKWIYTTIDAPKSFHQVLVWTPEADYEKNKSVLLEVTDSFKETDASADPGPTPGKKK